MSSITVVRPMSAVKLAGKRVIIREDFNVPMQQGQVMDDSRIRAALPTITAALAEKAAVILLSHLGRPQEGRFDHRYSLSPLVPILSQALGCPVRFAKNWLEGVSIQPTEVVFCENVRFQPGERANDPELAKKMARLGDVFVMDAFATAHRAQASTTGITEYIEEACAGPLLLKELQTLSNALSPPRRPLVAIVGGAKVSSKIKILAALIEKVDVLIVGGGMANTFLAAQGCSIGRSLCEPDWLGRARDLLQRARARGVRVPLPSDVTVAKAPQSDAEVRVCDVNEVQADEMILDIGPKTAQTYPSLLRHAATILWNGPVGMFELAPFARGTRLLGEAIANSDAFSIAGGGDTLAAVSAFGLSDRISYLSTGGGAFLTYLEGSALPAIVALEKRAK